MQIAYCYIENFVNIREKEVNFGSPYIFETVKTDEGYCNPPLVRTGIL